MVYLKKTWNRIIITCFIFIIVGLAGATVFFWTPYQMYKIYENIDKGQWNKAKEIYDEMSPEQKDKVMLYMEDYAATICQEYIDKEKSYIHTAASFDAINSIDVSGTIASKYMPDISRNEFKRAVLGLFEANRTFDANGAVEAQNNISAVQQRLDNDTREKLMIEMLNEKYQEFLDGKLSENDFNGFITIISGMSFYDANAYIGTIVNNVKSVVHYRDLYAQAEKDLQLQDYFSVLRICLAVQIDPYDIKYQELYLDLYNRAYIVGKSYYESQLNSLIDSGESAKAVALMEKIAGYYGDDFDLSSAKMDLAKDWQKTYIDITTNVDSILQTKLNETETGQYILQNKYKDIRPDSLAFYDMNVDGVPEMFLFNEANINNDYVECFVFGFDGKSYIYLGYVNLKSFCSDSSLVAVPIPVDRTLGEEYLLVSYDGTTFTEGTCCQYIDGKYYVDYSEVDDVAYLSAQSEVLAKTLERGISRLEYVNIHDSESYILAFE